MHFGSYNVLSYGVRRRVEGVTVYRKCKCVWWYGTVTVSAGGREGGRNVRRERVDGRSEGAMDGGEVMVSFVY